MIRIFLADDHELVRRGIAEILEREPDMTVVGEAGTARAAVARIDALEVDVAVLDYRLPDGTGVGVCREVRSRRPALPCIILTAFDDEAALDAAVLAGASGWLLKDIRGTGLVEAVRDVAAGRRLIGDAVRRRAHERLVQQREDDAADLTLRERQILGLITEGLTNRQIGERLGIAEKTVKNYVTGLLDKLGLERRTQAAVYGMAHRRPGGGTAPGQ
ncbi:response regulator transcription factor [Microbacterium betulae]|uniref:Response regulator transcription factor n=1 Tax=Microbacterium betulae TaxID=2981139 RepID=A0AA97I6E9_9MICO|nr:response regulator transcription factor [Microbacterium sp. AB]WOF22547.1 response regulator transcription factor [Microbacterium sp. AB]